MSIFKPKNGTNSTCKIEAWVCSDFDIYKTYWYATLYGLEIPGILLKYTLDSHARAPMVGDISSYVAAEVKSIDTIVPETAFDIPAGYTITKSLPKSSEEYAMLVSVAKLNGYLKKNTQALKKAKKYPTNNVDETVRFNVSEDWDF